MKLPSRSLEEVKSALAAQVDVQAEAIRLTHLTAGSGQALISDANQLACVLGYGPADAGTFGAAFWRDASGYRYAVASGLMGESFPTDAVAPLTAPAWGADMEAAMRAQALLRLGGAASPEALVAVIGDDPWVALEELGVERVEDGAPP